MVVHGKTRANKRYIPASTFKVPNSLIGLTTGAVRDVEELIPYGGKPQFLKIWEQDMGLRDAIKVSNVPVYQEPLLATTVPKRRSGTVVAGTGDVWAVAAREEIGWMTVNRAVKKRNTFLLIGAFSRYRVCRNGVPANQQKIVSFPADAFINELNGVTTGVNNIRR